MRRSLAILMLAFLLATGPAAALAAPAPLFADLPPEHPAARAVGALFLAGAIQGDDQGRFRPDDPVTRAELVKMVLAARGIAVGQGCQPRFRDVPCTAWYGRYVEMAYRLALVEGRGAGRFDPLAPVTRQEAFVITVRALGKWWEISRGPWADWAPRLGAFRDGSAVAGWAARPVAYLAARGVLSPGVTPELRPAQPATRAEIALLLEQALLPTLQGRQAVQVDGAMIRFARALEMQATKYATGEDGVGTVTYTGLTVREGAVAVDPAVIPLGSLVYVPGYGYGVAADIGGAIKGRKIDLFTEDLAEAAFRFGVRPVQVYLLD